MTEGKRGNLVLVRKRMESILMSLPNGDEIMITIIELTQTNKVKIAINAPANVFVLRKELYEKAESRNSHHMPIARRNDADACKTADCASAHHG